jgi:hypothetical protein
MICATTKQTNGPFTERQQLTRVQAFIAASLLRAWIGHSFDRRRRPGPPGSAAQVLDNANDPVEP